MLHNLINNNNDSILILAYSQNTSIISHITQKLVREVGGEVDVDRSTKHYQVFNVLWFKVIKDQIDASILLSSGSTLLVKDSRVSLRTEKNQDNSRYIIHVINYEKKYKYHVPIE